MSILETVQHHWATLQQSRRVNAIGADLIPRAPQDDDRFADVDLVARACDVTALDIGRARLDLFPEDLPAELRQRSERIAEELRNAGPDEIGRWATDIVFAYATVRDIAPTTEAAMYQAWALAIDATLNGRAPPEPWS